MKERSNVGPSDEAVAGGTGATGEQLKRALRARNDAATDRSRLLEGAAWDDFCDSLKRAGRNILAANPGCSEIDRAEGYRYLSGLLNAAIRFAVDFRDPKVPCFFRSPDSRTKWGAENADNQYLFVRISPEHVYRLFGRRNRVFDFLIEVKEGFMQLGDDAVYETRSSGDLEIAEDGSFEIVLSAERPQGHTGNWIPIHGDAKYITIRQYFYDWDDETPASFEVECLDRPGEAPEALTAAAMARVLDDAGEWVEVSSAFWQQWVDRIRDDWKPGEIAEAKKYVGGAETIRYGNDYYHVEPGRALIVETDVPDARYWAFQLCGLWFESADYTNRQTSINGRQAHIDLDGRFRCVLAHEDPGVPNWLDTAGHTEGLLQYRWIWTRDNPRPTCRDVALADLRGALPADTPTVTPDMRRSRIGARQRAVALREPWGR
jgi:hypothetical protein